jgi:hypothetical protein
MIILTQLPLSLGRQMVTGTGTRSLSCHQVPADIFFLHSCARCIRAATYNDNENWVGAGGACPSGDLSPRYDITEIKLQQATGQVPRSFSRIDAKEEHPVRVYDVTARAGCALKRKPLLLRGVARFAGQPTSGCNNSAWQKISRNRR